MPFRPSLLAKELAVYDAGNVVAAGSFVIRKPGWCTQGSSPSYGKSCHSKPQSPPATVVILIQLQKDNPFGVALRRPGVVQFVSILSDAACVGVAFPIALPKGEEWIVRIVGSKNRFVYGVYRRHMKTIGYLGHVDRLFGVPATTRSWRTILSFLRNLKSNEPASRPPNSGPMGPLATLWSLFHSRHWEFRVW